MMLEFVFLLVCMMCMMHGFHGEFATRAYQGAKSEQEYSLVSRISIAALYKYLMPNAEMFLFLCLSVY